MQQRLQMVAGQAADSFANFGVFFALKFGREEFWSDVCYPFKPIDIQQCYLENFSMPVIAGELHMILLLV